MKLLYIMTGIASKGGLTRIVFDKINYLVNSFNVAVVYFGNGTEKPFYKVDERVVFYPIKDVDAYSSFSKKIRSLLNIILQYKQIVNEIHPDIIINANANLLSWIIPFLNKHTPKIVELHQSYEGVKIFNDNAYGRNSIKGNFLFFLRNKIYPLYDKVVVLTEVDKKSWGYDNVIVIPNFTNIEPNSDLDYSQKCMIWVGRLSHQKGCDLLIDIWKKFHDKKPDWHLILIGDNIAKEVETKNKILDFVKDKKYKNSITHILDTQNIQEYYKKASVFISTSRFEGLPLVLIEAATSSLPIIGFDITGNESVVIQNRNGYLVKAYDIDSYVNILDKYCNDEILREKSGHESFKISKRFSKENILSTWIDLFNALYTNK